MYKQSQLKRMTRLAEICRKASMVVLAVAMFVLVAMLGPILSITGQLLLGLGTVIFAWLTLLSRLRKQAATAQDESPHTGKYSLDFD